MHDGRLAQLGERLPYKQDVGSSILSSPTIFDQSKFVHWGSQIENYLSEKASMMNEELVVLIGKEGSNIERCITDIYHGPVV